MGVNYFQRKTGSAPVLEPAPLTPGTCTACSWTCADFVFALTFVSVPSPQCP